MGMNTHVVGFRPPDEKWHEMKKVWDTCTEAKVEIPQEVEEFFDYEHPDPRGVEIELEDEDCCSEYNEEMRDGFEIDIKKLPKDVTVIRFWNSY